MDTKTKIQFEFEQTNWHQSSNEILAVRHKVFMIEQHFGEHILYDVQDLIAFHLTVRNCDGLVIGCGRITKNGRIGRIAVLLPYRGDGIGSKILNQLIALGQCQHINDISLNAELENNHFYRAQSFAAAGPVFMRQGVPHQMYARKLA